MARNLIYKKDGEFHYSGDIEPYVVQSSSEVSEIPTSDSAQAVIILGSGNGMTIKLRLPGEDWTEV